MVVGVGLGCIAAGAKQVTPDIMLAAAKAAAIKLTPEELEQDSILPQVDRIRCLPAVHLHELCPHLHWCLCATNIADCSMTHHPW